MEHITHENRELGVQQIEQHLKAVIICFRRVYGLLVGTSIENMVILPFSKHLTP
jgi:hypothetical protein